MRFAIAVPQFYSDGQFDPAAFSAYFARAEELGFDSVFCVVNDDHGTLTIEHSTLHHNPSGQFQDAPGIFDSRNGHDVQPVVIDSIIN